MVKRIGGSRRKTRAKFSKNYRSKGKISIRQFLQKFSTGEKVILKAETAYQQGMYFPRFHGRQGIVQGRQGACYQVIIKDGDKEKMLIVHPVHLRKA
ncbi:MAG TPA: 50S ribosomal protein L21e [Candidatus Nanoarchaeia archaeon]|nr:50S ribosomal protein L21e [Candidatus Nanoarchaeia archaeon]